MAKQIDVFIAYSQNNIHVLGEQLELWIRVYELYYYFISITAQQKMAVNRTCL